MFNNIHLHPKEAVRCRNECLSFISGGDIHVLSIPTQGSVLLLGMYAVWGNGIEPYQLIQLYGMVMGVWVSFRVN
jgi:hypothetical protein